MFIFLSVGNSLFKNVSNFNTFDFISTLGSIPKMTSRCPLN